MHSPSNAHKAEAGTVMGELCKALAITILHSYTQREKNTKMVKSEFMAIELYKEK